MYIHVCICVRLASDDSKNMSHVCPIGPSQFQAQWHRSLRCLCQRAAMAMGLGATAGHDASRSAGQVAVCALGG